MRRIGERDINESKSNMSMIKITEIGRSIKRAESQLLLVNETHTRKECSINIISIVFMN